MNDRLANDYSHGPVDLIVTDGEDVFTRIQRAKPVVVCAQVVVSDHAHSLQFSASRTREAAVRLPDEEERVTLLSRCVAFGHLTGAARIRQDLYRAAPSSFHFT